MGFGCYCAFFFSSRRRHTRYIGDWSSDVCSSDLMIGVLGWMGLSWASCQKVPDGFGPGSSIVCDHGLAGTTRPNPVGRGAKIGRASCRERGGGWGGGVAVVVMAVRSRMVAVGVVM